MHLPESFGIVIALEQAGSPDLSVVCRKGIHQAIHLILGLASKVKFISLDTFE